MWYSLTFILQIRDGDNSLSPLLGRFCGSSTPGNITSSGNSLWIEFHSDASVADTGFLAHFTTFDSNGKFIVDVFHLNSGTAFLVLLHVTRTLPVYLN